MAGSGKNSDRYYHGFVTNDEMFVGVSFDIMWIYRSWCIHIFVLRYNEMKRLVKVVSQE